MEQTAVNSLVEQLLPFIDRSKISDTALQNIVEEHILMEKEQIEDAFDYGLLDVHTMPHEYYNRTYGKVSN